MDEPYKSVKVPFLKDVEHGYLTLEWSKSSSEVIVWSFNDNDEPVYRFVVDRSHLAWAVTEINK